MGTLGQVVQPGVADERYWEAGVAVDARTVEPEGGGGAA